MNEVDFSRSRQVREITINVTYSDTTSALAFQLPKGARIIDWIINVKTALSGGTTTLDIGTRTDSDYFVDGVACAAVGKASPTLLYPGHEVTALVEEVYMNVGASNTAGSIDVTCLFSLEEDTPR